MRLDATPALLFSAMAFLAGVATAGEKPYPGWRHSGSVFLLTTAEGAGLPATAEEKGFPLLVRLHGDFFDFGQAKADGADLRFSTREGAPLAYQIDEWDAGAGHAAIWVRLPVIKGDARQELRLHWGKADGKSESNGAAVFNASNGYASVWHMAGPAKDEVGTLPSRDAGTTAVRGMIGEARHFSGGKGIFCGDKIPDYPSGGGAHSTEAWFRAERPNATLIGWGNEGGGRGSKVRMLLRSPPHLHIDSDFSDVDAPRRLPLGEWTHVLHTYAAGQGRIYVNGELAGAATPKLDIKTPSRLWIGGWYHNYDFVGDIDEVRISRVARSADWARLQFKNQKQAQTIVGPVVQEGDAFSVSHEKLTVEEGKNATITARAGGALKLYWILTRDGRETVSAVDRLNYKFKAGRVVGDQAVGLRLKAVYPDGVRSKDIAITVKEAIPEPAFALEAPAAWDGRKGIEVVARVANLEAMRAADGGALTYRWTVSGPAVVKEVAPGRLLLKRALNSGALSVALALGNGGAETMRTATITVKEPASDPWLQRVPTEDEKPQDGQFYARDDRGEGTLHCNGKLAAAADAVFLKLYADGKLFIERTMKPGPAGTYAFAVKLKPGLVKYRAVLGTRGDGRETVLHAASDLVCGDAYLINGQSNAEATDVGKDDPPFTSEWVRSFGAPGNAKLATWSRAVCRDRKGGKGQVGYWGLELGRRLVEAHKLPVCILNGAVGGSRIDQHQRNEADPEDAATIYGRLLHRVRQARLTHGIRGILWHQGENDQGADGPTGRFGWETYRDNFAELAAGWKRDYPNARHVYAFQIRPRACSMGRDGSDDMLREVQRRLPSLHSGLRLMSTLGIKPPGGCHYPLEGYAEFARLIAPLVERDSHGKAFDRSITPPDLVRASWADGKKDEIVLEFDQPVLWKAALARHFHLDAGKVVSGAASGNVLRLKLAGPSSSRRITYIDGGSWKDTELLVGMNGIAALTFCAVPVFPK